MSKAAPPFAGFEPEFEAGVRQIFEEKIVFNQVIGLKLASLGAERVSARLEMKPQLVGHFTYGRLHGGVISASLDALGGLAVEAELRDPQAGQLALDMMREGSRAWDKSPGNPVTEADLAVNDLIAARLRGVRPEYGWLSEETKDNPADRSQHHVWVVDPIDGTKALIVW